MFHTDLQTPRRLRSLPLPPETQRTTPLTRVPFAAAILSACLIFAGSIAHSQDVELKPDATEQAKSVSKKRLETMQGAIDAFIVTSTEIEPETAVKLGKTPKLRYDDQVRNLLDAGVWRLGDEGRPTAFVTIELYGAGQGVALLTYEFVSLTERSFSMISQKGPQWTPNVTELKFEALAEGPVASDSEKTRLTQMRQIVRRFTARQNYKGEKLELRLLPQPIDRYKDEKRTIVDGAVFVFANGTNPELGILVETDGKGWKYGLFRLSSAAITLELDGKDVNGIPPNAAYGTSRAYTATRHSVRLPE